MLFPNSPLDTPNSTATTLLPVVFRISCVAFQVVAHAQSPQPRTNVQTHECVSTEWEDDQILRTETTTGGETGGEWISTANKAEPNSGTVGMISPG